MPEEGIDLQPKDNMLTDAEVVKLATLFVNEGVNKIRLTGGEPTVRKGIGELICTSANLAGVFWTCLLCLRVADKRWEMAGLGAHQPRPRVSDVTLTDSSSLSSAMPPAASLNTLRSKGLTQIGMTSNGIALHRKLPEMVSNGLTHLNLS